MGKLTVFNFVTLNGFFKGPHEDISWHKHAAQENNYAAKMLGADNILLFGRITYEMMSSYWPTPGALQNNAAVAQGMNRAEKIVFSTTLNTANWQHTRIVKNDLAAEIKKLKKTSGKDIAVLGSGTLVTQLAELNLVDNYEIMLDPVAIGEGTPIFKGIRRELNFKLKESQTFKSGLVLLSYQPA